MYIHKLPNADAAMITVGAAATSLQDLIEAASSAVFKVNGLNAIDIIPEDGDIRVYIDGNTPTAAKGILLKSGGFYAFRGVPLSKMLLIRTSGDVSCSIQVGNSEPDESTAVGLPASIGAITVDTEFSTATEDAAAGTAGIQVMGRYDATPRTLDDGDAGSIALDAAGKALTLEQSGSLIGPGDPSITSFGNAVLSAVTGANQVVVAAQGANTQIWVYGYSFTCDTDATTVAFQDEDDNAHDSYTEGFAQYGGISIAPSGNWSMPLFKVATNKALEVDVATGTIGGKVLYAVVDVS